MKSIVSMVGRFVGSLTWLITGVASLYIGLTFWYGESVNIFPYLLGKENGVMIAQGMFWVIGVAGIVSLLMFVAKLFKKCCPCGCPDCVCDKSCCK